MPPTPTSPETDSSSASLPPAPRDPKNRDLPPNLYESGGYYTYRDPRTGQKFGCGTDRAAAIEEARGTNAHLAIVEKPSLIERVEASDPPAPLRTVTAFAPLYRLALDERDPPLAPITLYGRKRHLARIELALGDMEIGPRQEDATEITRRCAEWLKEIRATGKATMAKRFQTTLADMFSEVAAAGWCAVNPIEALRIAPAKVRRARLSLEQFHAIYEAAGKAEPWVRRSMELGLVALQRREDVSAMGFRDEEAGRVRVVQHKTGARLRIPVSIRLQALGWSLEDVIGRCRDNVLSRHLVHHVVHQGRAKPGDKVHPQTITSAFRLAREAAGITVEAGKTPPTFHELRSLGARLYKAQGYDPQDLLGHRDPETTRTYTDSRGSEWIDVAA